MRLPFTFAIILSIKRRYNAACILKSRCGSSCARVLKSVLLTFSVSVYYEVADQVKMQTLLATGLQFKIIPIIFRHATYFVRFE